MLFVLCTVGTFALASRLFDVWTMLLFGVIGFALRHYRFPVAPNILMRDFAVDAPNTAWVTDITYLATLEGWLYLACVLDLFSRRIVGWSPGARMDADLQKIIDERTSPWGITVQSVEIRDIVCNRSSPGCSFPWSGLLSNRQPPESGPCSSLSC